MIVGISGASGVIYGIRLLEVLAGVDDTPALTTSRPIWCSPRRGA